MEKDADKQVIATLRNYVINVELFRHMVAKHLGIHSTDMECLSILFHKKVSSPSELSKYTNLGSGATTAMLDRLEQKGFIERQPNPRDARGTRVVVTQKAIQKITPLFDSLTAAEQKLIAGYSDQELQLIQNFMEKEAAIWEEERERLRPDHG